MKAQTFEGTELPMRGLGDARLAIHASSSLPAWLWSINGARILWANPIGARLFGMAKAADLTRKTFGPADAHRRQITNLATRLRPDGPPRLERLRGFGAPLGRLVTFGCARLRLADGTDALLIAAVEPFVRAMPLRERLQWLVEDAEMPLAAFGRDGVFVGASTAARALMGFRDLSEAGLDIARADALQDGRSETPIGIGHLVLQRVGSGADIGLIALLQPATIPKPIVAPAPPQLMETAMPSPAPVAEPLAAARPVGVTDAMSASEAPADLALFDEFADFAEDEPPSAVSQFDDAQGDGDSQDDASDHHEPLKEMRDKSEDEIQRDEPDHADDNWPPRAQPLRFMWDIDSGERFRVRSDELRHLIGPRAAASLDAPWRDVASAYASYGRMASAIASRDVWSGVSLALPADAASEPLIAELSGIPAFDDGTFTGYRGFGVVSDLVALGRLETLRHRESDTTRPPRSLSAHIPSPPRLAPALVMSDPIPTMDISSDNAATPSHIVPLRASDENGSAMLSPVESNAFNELARELSARLDADPIGLSPDHQRAVEQAIEAAIEPDASRIGAAAGGSVARPETADAQADDLMAVLDALDEAILICDADGQVRSANHAAKRLLGSHGDDLVGRSLVDICAPDTRPMVSEHLDRLIKTSLVQNLTVTSESSGAATPLSLTMSRIRPGGSNVYAILRDLAPTRETEAELAQARRQTGRAVADKADILARISDEMRAPLSAIIGFADVMIEQRFGPLGNERYADYLRDIRGCGERVVAIVDDLLDLAQIETGRRDLSPAPQDLNDLVEQCVAAMQPQANRERIIIRSSLAHPLPRVVADGASLRQIALNMIGNSMHLANPGGQVIVSTVRADSGDVLLRVRDTGHGLNDNEVATALAPFRPATADPEAPALIRLSLTRALAEANHARFSIKPAPYAGTLIEIAFAT